MKSLGQIKADNRMTSRDFGSLCEWFVFSAAKRNLHWRNRGAEMKNKKYSLTDEHRAQLKPWSDKWIANAMSTKAMDDEDRRAMVEAVEGLYRAADLTPPPHHRIVFVSSPFMLRFAGGLASAIWHLRKENDVDATYATTRAVTSDATYWRFPSHFMRQLAQKFRPSDGTLLLSSAQYVDRMWNGGNQWSAWSAYLSFFDHVVGLNLPIYEKWRHYEAAAIHAGPRMCVGTPNGHQLVTSRSRAGNTEWRQGTRDTNRGWPVFGHSPARA